jgi:hypothetical protein
MSTLTFQSVGAYRGVEAIAYLGQSDCAGIVMMSNDATNTSSVFAYSARPPTVSREIDATLRAAFNRYDLLLRRLAD